MKLVFFKTTELKGSIYVKIRISSTILIIENAHKYCFLWSILASLYPSNKSHSHRVSNDKQDFDELNVQGFDFTKEFYVEMFVNLKR